MLGSYEKVKGVEEVASGAPYSKEVAFNRGRKPFNPRVETHTRIYSMHEMK